MLRIVGDLSFFQSLKPGSTLKSVANFYQQRLLVNPANVRNIAWSSPNWSSQNLWIPTMTSRFHECLKNMPSDDQNVCFNTVLALAKPDIDLLIPRPPERDRVAWYVSSLKGYTHRLSIVWIPKCRGNDLLIEAHFAGTKHSCNTFIQKHKLPTGACLVLPNLSGVREIDCIRENPGTSDLIISWPLTNPLQNAIRSHSMEDLPQGSIVLDHYQHEIAISAPPLLVESRSG